MNILTRCEAMEQLKVGHTKLWEMERDGKICPIRRDGRLYFEQAEIDAYWEDLKKRRTPSICLGGTYRKRRVKSA